MQKILVLVKLTLVTVFLAVLLGCAAPAHYSQMSVSEQEIPIRKSAAFVDNISLKEVTGGMDKSVWMSDVDNKSYEAAVSHSLSNLGYLALESSKNARYKLIVSLQELKQPMLGIDLKVVCKAQYSLYDIKLNKVVYEKSLTTPYTAPFSSSLIAAKRLRIASEGAVKENIKQFLSELNEMKAKPVI